jgi:hypothetical protein
MGHGDDIRTGRHRVFALHAHLVFVTTYRHAVFTAAHLARMEEIRRGGVRRLRVRAGPALLAGKAAVVGVVLGRLGRRRTPGRAPRLHRAATPTARGDFTSGLKAAALSQKIGGLGWRSELPRPGAGRPSFGPAEQVAEGGQGGRDAGAVPGEGAPVGPPDRIPLSASGRLKCASCGWMVTVRPARLLVHEDASGQTWQARPKRATPPRRGPGGSEP